MTSAIVDSRPPTSSPSAAASSAAAAAAWLLAPVVRLGSRAQRTLKKETCSSSCTYSHTSPTPPSSCRADRCRLSMAGSSGRRHPAQAQTSAERTMKAGRMLMAMAREPVASETAPMMGGEMTSPRMCWMKICAPVPRARSSGRSEFTISEPVIGVGVESGMG